MNPFVQSHMIAFTAGTILDLIVGDPYTLPHPIRWIGTLIGKLDGLLMGEKKTKKQEDPGRAFRRGILLWVAVVAVVLIVTSAVTAGSYLLGQVFGIAIETILTCYCLAGKSLCVESMKVHRDLVNGDLPAARRSVSMIVGRDTAALTEEGVAKAAVETVAENASDGVIAPMLMLAIGGPILGFFYKAINTMDSMVGYHNDRYEYFGRFAAKADDVANYIPSRLSAIFMIAAAYLLGLFGKEHYSGVNAAKIYRRDRYNHKSPNSAQTESVCAGALGLQLAGDASYFGKVVKKPTIGDPLRPIEPEDIRRANRLMFVTEGICYLLMILVLVIAA